MLTPEQSARLAELRAKYGKKESSAQKGGLMSDPRAQAVAGIVKGAGDFIEGFGNKAAQTTFAPIARLIGMKDVAEGINNAAPKSGAGEMGATVADVGLQLAPIGKAKGLARFGIEAGRSAVQHAAQDYGREGEISTGKAGTEAGITAILNSLGGGAQKLAAKAAPNVLKFLTPKAMKLSDNPPDWDYALQRGYVKPTGGAKSIIESVSPRVKARASLRDELLKESGVRANIPAEVRKTVSMLKKDVGGEGRSAITARQFDLAQPFASDAIRTAKVTSKKPFVSGEKAVDLRQIADDRAKSAAFQKEADQLPGEGVFYRKYREVLEDALLKGMKPKEADELAKAVSKAYRKGKSPMAIDEVLQANEAQKGRFGRYVANKYELGKLTPINLAAKDMAAANTMRWTLPLDLGIAGAGLGYGLWDGDLEGRDLLPTAALLAGRRLGSTPGGARLLYDFGKSDKARLAGKGALSLARSAHFGDDE